MKIKHLKYPVLCFMLLILSKNSIGQDYQPFFLDNAEWTIRETFPVIGNGPTDSYEYWRYYTTHDTIINDKVYRIIEIDKLCQDFYNPNNNVYNDQFEYDEFPIGAIREENKKVYFYKFEPEFSDPEKFDRGYQFLDHSEEHLLYDFDFEIGDTIHFSNTSSFTVSNGDTTFITKEHYTIIRSEASANSYYVSPSSAWSFPNEEGLWIEGLGSEYGLFGSYNSFLTDALCFKKDGLPMTWTFCDNCTETISLAEELNNYNITLYPNPFIDLIYVDGENLKQLNSMKIYNVLGQQVDVNWKRNQDKLEIDLHKLTRGTYFLKLIFDPENYLIKKIIKRE